MARLFAYLLTSGLTVGVGLVVVDAARFTVAQINDLTAQRCDTINSVLPGGCEMPR